MKNTKRQLIITMIDGYQGAFEFKNEFDGNILQNETDDIHMSNKDHITLIFNKDGRFTYKVTSIGGCCSSKDGHTTISLTYKDKVKAFVSEQLSQELYNFLLERITIMEIELHMLLFTCACVVIY